MGSLVAGLAVVAGRAGVPSFAGGRGVTAR